MFNNEDWRSKVSQPIHSDVLHDRDLSIPMRDGIRLAADVHRPDIDEQVPVLLAFQPWGKDHDALSNVFPAQRRPSSLWDGTLEAGISSYFVSRGYAHVIVDARGTGASEGLIPGIMGGGQASEGPDIYDVVEWLAEQDWCDGNVGMVGISYLAAVQLLAAAEQPPHLKAIFPEGGHYDIYPHQYHGGILWKMPRAAFKGRGGDSMMAINNPRSLVLEGKSEQEKREILAERLADPDIAFDPNYSQLVKYPDLDPVWLDYILSPTNGEFYSAGGKAEERNAKITIPVHLGVMQGRGWQVEETIEAYQHLGSPVKQLALRPGPPMQERPFHEFHDEIIRWYDHWLKGNDTGMLDQPPISIFVEGSKRWIHTDQWPLPDVVYEKLYLRPGGRLSDEAEHLSPEVLPPDGYYQAPERVTTKVASLEYTTLAFPEDTDFVGPAALYLDAEIDQPDTNWMITLYDIDTAGQAATVSTGWLKASHREIDEERSTVAAPHHPHTRAVPVPVGEIITYPIRIYPISWTIRQGHSLRLEIKSLEAPSEVNPMLPPESSHLNSARATTHKIYRDALHQSHLVLPLLPRRAD